MKTYAYLIENGVVVDGLVGTAEWAVEQFGGLWVQTDTKAWIGGTWDEQLGFMPPVPAEE